MGKVTEESELDFHVALLRDQFHHAMVSIQWHDIHLIRDTYHVHPFPYTSLQL